MALIVVVLVIGVVIFMLAPVLLKFRSARSQDPLLRLWRKFIRKLVKAGFIAHPSMGPMELSTNAGSQLKYNRDGIARIAELYMLCRYSRETGRRAELADLVNSFQVRST